MAAAASNFYGKLPEEEFLGLLKKVIGLASKLQNNPPDHVPQEELVCDVVIEYLKPYTAPNGPLIVRKVGYVPNRANVIITYPGTEKGKVVSFVGCHMDVVPANPETWKVPAFTLTQDGDKLSGRGVTDCLGHVCLLACFFKTLAVAKPALKQTVICVAIANEENSSQMGIGIDEMEKRGELEQLKNGPLYWIDSANFGPTLGTGGMATWQLTISGRQFHSGFPHNGINSIELAHKCVDYLQRRFYADFTKYEAEEKKYLFQIGSSLKPTRIETPKGSLNQIPGSCTVAGDIRFTPFYSINDVTSKVEQYVKDLQSEIPKFTGHGVSKYKLADPDVTGTATLAWLDHPYKGVAVKLDSVGYKVLHDAIAAEKGAANPFSLTGSLPIIRDLQDAGFDVQITGFGTMAAYHANDEFGLLSDFHKGFGVLNRVVAELEKH